MVSLSKRYQTALKAADLTKAYPLTEAIAILKRMPAAKFDETVEVSFRLAVDPKQSDQMIRGVVSLPHGSGKKVRVLAFTDRPEEALKAGADFAGLDDIVKKITDENWTDFDVAVATTGAMKAVRTVARVLGPRGLMPNPKSGTVGDDVAGMIKAIKLGGRVEYKMDKTGNVACIVGKRSFAPDALKGNIEAVLESLAKGKPDSLKGTKLVKSATVSATMSPGVKLDPAHYTAI